MDNSTLTATRALIARAGTIQSTAVATRDDSPKPAPSNTGIVVRDENTNRIVGYYDPPTLTEEYEMPEFQTVSYATGVPIVKGKPFWERLPNEDIDIYELFTHYRDQHAPRILSLTAEHYNVEPEVVDVISQLWAWPERANAYDDYAQVLVEKERSRRIVVMEDKHSKVARALFDKAKDTLNHFTEDDFTPGQALALMKQALELERLANRLPADEPMEVYELKAGQKKDSPNINLNGEGSKVQINFTKDWNPG